MRVNKVQVEFLDDRDSKLTVGIFVLDDRTNEEIIEIAADYVDISWVKAKVLSKTEAKGMAI